MFILIQYNYNVKNNIKTKNSRVVYLAITLISFKMDVLWYGQIFIGLCRIFR